LYFSGMLGLSVASRLTPGRMRRHVAGNLARRRLLGTPLAEWGLSEMARNDPSVMLEAGWAIGQFRSHDWIGGVAVPTAVVVTTRDQVVGAGRQRRLADAIPGASRFEVDGDHGACVNAAELYVPTLVEACLDVAQRSGRSPA
ncbi:MAG: hypothetical protein ACRDZW_02280, partial [Acidimicrobiales bacterium]